MRVYKFYSADRAIENLKQRRLKISTLKDLNDPFEFRGVRMPYASTRAIWEATRTKLFHEKGIICFCRSWSNPVIWSHYADNHRGLALGFDVPSDLLIPVSYRKTKAKFPQLSSLPPERMLNVVRTAIARKFKHWEYEEEYRAFVEADEVGQETGLYFKDFAPDLELREIVIGSESKLSSDFIKEETNFLDIPTTNARLAFNSYKIVKQQKARKQR